MFYNLFAALCEKNKIKPSRAAEDIGISRATVSAWKKYGYTPRDEVKQKIANYFNVSLDFLSGRDETKKGSAEAEPVEQPDEDDIRYALSGEIKDLTDEEFDEIMNYIKFVEQKRRKK